MGGEPAPCHLEFSLRGDGDTRAIQYLRFESRLLAEQCDDFGDVIHDVSSLSEVTFLGFGDASFGVRFAPWAFTQAIARSFFVAAARFFEIARAITVCQFCSDQSSKQWGSLSITGSVYRFEPEAIEILNSSATIRLAE
jgi:hypothetical protein